MFNENPGCVDGNDDSCGLQSELTLATPAVRRLYIFVTGFTSATGMATLTVTCNK